MTEETTEINLEKSEDVAKKETDNSEPAKEGSRKSKQNVLEQKESEKPEAPEPARQKSRTSKLDVSKIGEVKTDKPEDAAKQSRKTSKITMQGQKETETPGEAPKEMDKQDPVKLEVLEPAVKLEKSEDVQKKETTETRFEKLELPKIEPSRMSKPELEVSTSRLKMRKHSYGYGSVSGLKKHELSSAVGIEFKRPVLMYEPTFQLNPTTPFKPSAVEKIINRILDSVYDHHIYHVETSPTLAVSIANSVMRETKALHFNRYRVICIVVIGQKRKQCYTNTVCFLWDKARDGYADVERENCTTFIQVTVFGIYLD